MDLSEVYLRLSRSVCRLLVVSPLGLSRVRLLQTVCDCWFGLAVFRSSVWRF